MANEISLENFTGLSKLAGLKIVSLNVRSLLSKINIIRSDFQELGIDFLTLTETWLKENVINDLVVIPGYNILRWDRSTPDATGHKIKIGGGLCIYYRSDYTCKQLMESCISDPDLEACAAMFTKQDHNTIVILNLYRPPSGNLARALTHISAFLSDLVCIHRRAELFVVGDSNVDLLSNSKDSIDLLEVCNQAGLTNLINKPTRFGLFSATSIDICWSNSNFISSAGTIEYNVSDHLPVFCVKKKSVLAMVPLILSLGVVLLKTL